MAFFFEVLIGGLLAGVMYSLVALGFVLIYKASSVFNFAQGAMVFFAVLSFVGFIGGWLVAAWNLARRVQARVPARRGAIVWAALQLAAFTMLLYVGFAYHLLNFSAGY